MSKSENAQPKSTALSTQPYRGTRDFFPDEQRFRHFLFQKMHTVMKSFGYEEYDGPFVEPLELYSAKTSEEIVREQLYNLRDRGDRDIAIRPEMTPTLARMVASKVAELPKPIRWYSIPTCMRYERPQRGRLREFAQLNVDVFGGAAIDEDIEIILTAVRLLENLGATSDMFEVKMNHRGVVNDLFAKLKLEDQSRSELLRLLDKRDKISAEAFREGAKKIGISDSQISDLETFLQTDVDGLVSLFGSENPNVIALQQRMSLMREIIGSDAVKFNPDVMRGFDYYTGLVFEIYDKSPENRRALLGGGRYENLVGAFGVPALPGIGYGVSDVSLENFMAVHNLLPKLAKPIDVSVLRFSENDRLPCFLLSNDLRSKGLNVETAITTAKFGKQIGSAEKAGAFAVAFRGDEELKSQTFAVKWMKTGDQTTYPILEIDKFLADFVTRRNTLS